MTIAESRPLEEMLQDLPQDLRTEVRDFVEFLLQKRARKSKRAPTFSWAGALADMKDQYTSVELQHRIAEWRLDETPN